VKAAMLRRSNIFMEGAARSRAARKTVQWAVAGCCAGYDSVDIGARSARVVRRRRCVGGREESCWHVCRWLITRIRCAGRVCAR